VADAEAGWTSATARAFLALIDATEGRLVAARMQAAAAVAQASGPSRQTVVDIASLAAAIADAQHGQRAVPGEHHGVALASRRALREVDHAVRSALAAAGGTVRLDGKTARHPLAERALVALGVLDVVEAKGSRVPIGGPAESAVRTARGALAVAAFGSITELLEPWLTSHPEPRLSSQTEPRLSSQTEPRLSSQTEAAHPRTLVEASVLAAIATAAQGDQSRADVHLGRALAYAAPERLWAPLRAHGSALTASFESLARTSGPHQAAAMVLLDEARQLQAPPFVDALTDQEQAVLRLLSTLMSNAEIASAMQLSVNTIKTHLKALYRKLGVERRRDAVVRARQLELL
jgi:DNA-binding CsgD family transcriptional regulator